MATAQEFLEKAASYIGVGGTDNIFNTWYWGYHCYDPGTYPWCACFQSYVGVHDLGMPFEPSASAAGVAWQGTRVADKDVQPGDWVVFNWNGSQDFSWADHIAVVEWSDINGSGYFGTIDGNSGGGEGVVQRNTYYNWGKYATAFFRPPYSDEPSEPSEPSKPSEPSERSRLHIVDIASWQEGINISAVDANGFIIKVTGGTHYVNPFWRRWAEEVLANGKLLGLYHYAVESEDGPNAKAEAEYFLRQVADFKGRFIPVLDWEADALSLPASWARTWLDIVAKETGALPWFYGYASNVNNTDYSAVAEKYPLWMASYLNKYDGVGWVDNPDQTWGTGSWNSLIAYQYTSTGRVNGYNGRLDLNIAYCTPTQWQGMCGGKAPGPSPKPSSTQPYYNVMCAGTWCGKMEGLVDTTGSGDDFGGIYGRDMQYLAIGDAGAYQVHDINGNWWSKVDKYDLSDREHGMAGAGAPIDCVRIFDDSVKYQTHNKGGGWNDVMIGTYDTGGSGDDFAGQYGVPQDAIRIWRD